MKNTPFRIKPAMSLFACAACALGLLLWARLLLVSHPPRVATADPIPAAPAAGSSLSHPGSTPLPSLPSQPEQVAPKSSEATEHGKR